MEPKLQNYYSKSFLAQGRAPFNPNEVDVVIRPPKALTLNKVQNATGDNNKDNKHTSVALEKEKVKNLVGTYAKEFVPFKINTIPHGKSIQDRLQFSQATNRKTIQPVLITKDDEGTKLPNAALIAIDLLKACYMHLKLHPDDIDEVSIRFLTIFEDYKNDSIVLSNAVKIIYLRAERNPGMRSIGLKFMVLMHTMNRKTDSVLCKVLKDQIDSRYSKLQSMSLTSEKQSFIRNNTMFLMDLYMMLLCNNSRLKFLGVAIMRNIDFLQKNTSVENINCVCLVLKLIGSNLAIDCPDQLSRAMVELVYNNRKNPGKYILIGSVLSLHTQNWGILEAHNAQAIKPTDNP